MDSLDWKTYLVIAILVCVVAIIIWYKCPSSHLHDRLPGRPNNQKLLAPEPILANDNQPTWCQLTPVITKWGCNFDTTIYNVSDIHFSLSYTGNNGKEIFINKDISDDDLIITNNEADFHYAYEYSLPDDLQLGYYTLKIASFVPNAPEASVRHCNACTQDISLLPSQYEKVSELRLNQTVWYWPNVGDQPWIHVSWDKPLLSPWLNENDASYHLSIEDDDGDLVKGTEVTLDYNTITHSYSYAPPIGVGNNYKAVIYVSSNSNDICTRESSDTYSVEFSVISSSEMPTLIAGDGGNYCTSDNGVSVNWNVLCNDYTGTDTCPDDFSYSVHIYSGDQNPDLDLFFDNIVNDSSYTSPVSCGGVICDTSSSSSCCGIYSGFLNKNTANNYTFTITPMLPVGIYNETISMFLTSNHNIEIDVTAINSIVVNDNTSCGENSVCYNGTCGPCPQCPGTMECPDGCNNCRRCLRGTCDPESNTCVDCPECGNCPEDCSSCTSTCTGTSDTCVDGVCKCGTGSPCSSDKSDNCKNGQCMCGTGLSCPENQVCQNGKCKNVCCKGMSGAVGQSQYCCSQSGKCKGVAGWTVDGYADDCSGCKNSVKCNF